MSWRPSTELVSVRTQALVDRDGRASVASFYDVSERTVQNWIDGNTSPRSAANAVSISRRGRVETGAVIQQRGGGQFSSSRTIYNPSVTRAARTIAQNRREQRQAEVSVARNARQRQMIESRPVDVTYSEMRGVEQNLDRLREAEIARREGGYDYESEDWYDWWEENYGYDYDWDDFRSLYEQMSG